MLPVRKILCPTDFSEPSRQAANEALELAQHFGAEVLLLHVIPYVPPLPPEPFVNPSMPSDRERQEAAQKTLTILAEGLQAAAPAVPVTCEVRMGDAPHEIACAAEDSAMDLMVISTHGHTGWRHLVFGSVAEAVIRLAPCAVLTVRANKRAVPAPEPAEFAA